ncbi:pyrroline-5-carboxylate reductase [Natranaeroarchaeum aerophilus]|uniref:Pyrroline-5-carboxylate reductase n=1 Tax=Natranaeroarchaeum aerophilus TaxID=2917711 RepID=A0AAE3K4R8_9EURY|nr:pyrroline-5-carboxylate reductase [Natranaeroarchaeum aerophilus]MCL9813371.1 pyrroline-5-carboxylate reductase [Natranaeroarchaeum aerophilus]
MTDVSIIGCGNMGSALIRGLADSDAHRVTAIDVDSDALAAVEAYSDWTTEDIDAAAESDVVIIAVKPDVVGAILDELELSPDHTLVTFAAGVSTDFVAGRTPATVVRVMPNLAAATGNMAAAVTRDTVTDEVREILAAVGEFAEIDESRMDIATAVNGSGPAFVYYLIQGMKQAGIEGGLDPEQAETLAAQTFKGAAETALRSEDSLDDMIDAVCSPNGTTIEGMELLWDSDVHEELGAAVAAAEERSGELAEEATEDA